MTPGSHWALKGALTIKFVLVKPEVKVCKGTNIKSKFAS